MLLTAFALGRNAQSASSTATDPGMSGRLIVLKPSSWHIFSILEFSRSTWLGAHPNLSEILLKRLQERDQIVDLVRAQLKLGHIGMSSDDAFRK